MGIGVAEGGIVVTAGGGVLEGKINAVGTAGEVAGTLQAGRASRKTQNTKRSRDNMVWWRIPCILNRLVIFTKILHRQNHQYATRLYIVKKETNVIRFSIALIMTSIMSLACNPTTPTRIATTQLPSPVELPPQTEIPNNATGPATRQDTSLNVTNPSSRAVLYMAICYPKNWDGHTKLPTLVLVPGGSGDSASFIKKNPTGTSTVSVINENEGVAN